MWPPWEVTDIWFLHHLPLRGGCSSDGVVNVIWQVIWQRRRRRRRRKASWWFLLRGLFGFYYRCRRLLNLKTWNRRNFPIKIDVGVRDQENSPNYCFKFLLFRVGWSITNFSVLALLFRASKFWIFKQMRFASFGKAILQKSKSNLTPHSSIIKLLNALSYGRNGATSRGRRKVIERSRKRRAKAGKITF